MSSPTPSKGSLEDLFRHHLLESEAAAVPPRPHVWEQLDNSLLLAQNEKYRRRLLVHRWAVAASLLLAMLAGGGWWHSQQQATTPPLAQATPTGAEALGAAGRSVARASYARTMPTAVTTGHATSYGQLAAASATESTSSPATAFAIDQPATSSTQPTRLASHQILTEQGYTLVSTATSRHHGARTASLASHYRDAADAPATSWDKVAAHSGKHGVRTTMSFATASVNQHAVSSGDAAVATTPLEAALPPTASEETVMSNTGTTAAAFAQIAGVQTAAAMGTLTPQPVQLALLDGAALPNSLGTLPQPELPAPTLARRWQFGLAYAASAFQPNIDFTKNAASYNQALGASSAFITQSAATEYRNHLRAGLGQRLSLWATRRLGNGRFGLRTGLEVAQNMAYSASSVAFVGEQVADLSYTNVAPTQLRTTSYRYRTVSVPVELRYSNPAKSGFSFYSRIGGLFTALLNVRSDVEGNPEATRTYSLMSVSSPYRQLSASLRGGAGIQYRPASHQWGLSLGPVAEAGIMSLNADPVQDFWSQKRAYSFGLEAGVDLGRAPRVP